MNARTETNNVNRQQLELSFDASAAFRPHITRRQRRRNRAQWWFAQMRAVVDRAFDWKPAPPARPEQAQLALASSR